MALDKEQIKQLTVRWPESYWELVAIESKRRRSSVQEIITESVRLFMAMPESERDRILREAEVAAESEKQSAA